MWPTLPHDFSARQVGAKAKRIKPRLGGRHSPGVSFAFLPAFQRPPLRKHDRVYAPAPRPARGRRFRSPRSGPGPHSRGTTVDHYLVRDGGHWVQAL